MDTNKQIFISECVYFDQKNLSIWSVIILRFPFIPPTNYSPSGPVPSQPQSCHPLC